MKERKNERNLPEFFFKSQYDTFQCLTALHSLVTGALVGEAQRADAAARHKGRSKPWPKKIRVQYRGFIGIFSIPEVCRFFSNTGGLSALPIKIQGLIFDKPTVFWYFGR